VLDTFAAAAAALDVPAGSRWGVAMPDPFDYAGGIALFRDVGKFDALYGLDVGSALTRRMPKRPRGFVFVNDADAFILGEWAHGSAQGHSRCVGVTLGTGLGSGWLVDGRVVTDGPGVPELGRARNLTIDGTSLEDVVSRRGIRSAFAAAGGDATLDVHDIADLASGGDQIARDALETTFATLGRGLRAALRDFGAEVVVVGGSIAGSWSLVDPWFRAGLAWPDAPPVLLASHPDEAALRGAARATLP
jgi:glucokinase